MAKPPITYAEKLWLEPRECPYSSDTMKRAVEAGAIRMTRTPGGMRRYWKADVEAWVAAAPERWQAKLELQRATWRRKIAEGWKPTPGRLPTRGPRE